MATAAYSSHPQPPPYHHRGPPSSLNGNHQDSSVQQLQEQQNQPPWKSHAHNRTNELLSCARTAFKIAQQKRRQHQQQQVQQQQQHQGRQQHGGYGVVNDADLIPEWMMELDPNDLKLYQPSPPPFSHLDNDHDDGSDGTGKHNTQQLLKDSLTLLSILDSHLSDLHSLVRRRGHTNDPTLEIQNVLEKFQSVGVELKEGIGSLRMAGTLPTTIGNDHSGGTKVKSSTQRRRHYELLSDQLETDAKERTDKLKKELETRSKVLRDQTNHRRKLLGNNASNAGATSVGDRRIASSGGLGRGIGATRANQIPAKKTATTASQQFQSPLFTMTASSSSATTSSAPPSFNNASLSTGNAAYAGYGGTATNSAGYGGTAAPSFSTGMRQRKQPSANNSNNYPKSSLQIDDGHDTTDNKYDKSSSYDESSSASIQQQIHFRRQNRETQSRLASARLAEKSIAELGVMFTKMSTLITQQGEVLERIEDDVEAASGDIDAGHDEIVKLYGMTKGNRGLILKVFGILIALIIFMKVY